MESDRQLRYWRIKIKELASTHHNAYQSASMLLTYMSQFANATNISTNYAFGKFEGLVNIDCQIYYFHANVTHYGILLRRIVTSIKKSIG